MLYCFTVNAFGEVSRPIETGGSGKRRWAKLRLRGADVKFLTVIEFIAFADVADQIVSYVSKGDRLVINAYIKGAERLYEEGLIDSETQQRYPAHVYLVQDFRFTALGAIPRPIFECYPPKRAGEASCDNEVIHERDG